eukprot:scaffold51996_cov35-Prasinocladus_malaysianus.AAC.2
MLVIAATWLQDDWTATFKHLVWGIRTAFARGIVALTTLGGRLRGSCWRKSAPRISEFSMVQPWAMEAHWPMTDPLMVESMICVVPMLIMRSH